MIYRKIYKFPKWPPVVFMQKQDPLIKLSVTSRNSSPDISAITLEENFSLTLKVFETLEQILFYKIMQNNLFDLGYWGRFCALKMSVSCDLNHASVLC